MGVSVSAAFAVVNRIDDFAYTPEQNIAHAMTALMAQNKGAGKIDRIERGVPLRHHTGDHLRYPDLYHLFLRLQDFL